MQVEFKNEKVYIIGKPKEYLQRVPTRKHRLKNGSGTCSIDMGEFFELEKGIKTHILYVDMTLKKVLLFSREDVLPTIVKVPYMASSIYVAHLKALYLSGNYVLLGALNG